MKRPPHRPRNERRIASMLAWFDVACKESMKIVDPDDFRDVFENRPKLPEIPTEEWLNLVLRWLRSAGNPKDFTPDERARFEWLQDFQEEMPRVSSGPRADKMQVYRTAAALFNNQLASDQAHGDRLGEKPVTPSALQRAVHRERRQ